MTLWRDELSLLLLEVPWSDAVEEAVLPTPVGNGERSEDANVIPVERGLELKLPELPLVPAVLNSNTVLDGEEFELPLRGRLISVLSGSLVLAGVPIALVLKVWPLVAVEKGRLLLL